MKIRLALLALAAAALLIVPFTADALPPSCYTSCTCFSSCGQWCSVGSWITTCGEEFICRDYCLVGNQTLESTAANQELAALFTDTAALSMTGGEDCAGPAAHQPDLPVADSRPAVARQD